MGRPHMPSSYGTGSKPLNDHALPRVGVGSGYEHGQEQEFGPEESRSSACASHVLVQSHGQDQGYDSRRTRRQKTQRSAQTIASLKEGNSMQEFLDFRRSYKERSMDKLQAFPERTQEMLRELLYPATPDTSKTMRGPKHFAGEDINNPVIIFPSERLLHKCYLRFCRGSSMTVAKDDKNPKSSMSEGEISEEETGTRMEALMDLRGFTAFMKHLGLIPAQKQDEPIPLQNSLAIQCFKNVQREGNQRTLNFVDTKEVIHRMLTRGPDMLEKQKQNKQRDIAAMHQKIARMVPSCQNPLQEVKKVFSQLFDTIFDAFIFFDVSGDWTLTQNEFIQYCKMLQLPMTPADLKIAMSDQCHLEELDSISFVRCFKWYELVEKPKFRVMGYTVQSSENRLYQVFAWLASGCKPERILEMIEELERSLHAAFAAGMEQEAQQRGMEGTGSQHAGLDTSGVKANSCEPQAEQVMQRHLQPVSESPLASPEHQGSLGQVSVSGRAMAQQPIQEHNKITVQKPPAFGKNENVFFSEESRMVADSSERALNFQSFIDFLKVADLIPIHVHRAAGRMKADLSSAEFGEALRVFRQVLGKEKRLEWPEFKHCMYEMLTSKSLQKQLADAETELLNMRNALSRYAPTIDQPLEALKDALSIRFDSSVEAFVYFDMQGDWSVTQAEVQNMIKRLSVGLSKPDLDCALQAIFIASHGGGINANEFVRRLKWSQDDVSKVKELFDLYPYERRLFNEFVRWCDISNPTALDGDEAVVSSPLTCSPHHSPAPGSRRGSSRIVEVDAGGSRSGTASSKAPCLSRPSTKASADVISRLNTGAEMPPMLQDVAAEPEVRDMSSSSRLPFQGFEGFLQAIGLIKSDSSIDELQTRLAKQAFDKVNWTQDAFNVISWVEFKHVMHVFLVNVPLWLQPELDKLQTLHRRKRLELHEKVVTFKDPIAEFSALLATRFEDVFDAFVFFDMDGDWQVTNKEMHAMLPKLQLNMTTTDLDLTIAKIMRERNYKDEIFVDPKQFAKNLAWHPKPGTAPGLRRALDQAKERRPQVLERAIGLAKALGNQPEDHLLSILPDDEIVVDQMQKQIRDIQNMQRDMRRIKSFFGIPIDGRLAMEEDDIQRRKEVARQDFARREMQQSDKGISILLDRARLKRDSIVAEATRRSQDDVYARKLRGFKHGVAAEPPNVDQLLKWAPKLEGLELSRLALHVKRLQAALHRFRSQGKRLFNCKMSDLAMSTKLAHTRQEMFAHNRNMRKLAIEGEHQLVLDGLDQAKLRRRQITELAMKRAESLHASEWCNIEVPSPSVSQAFEWFQEAAKWRILGVEKSGTTRIDSFTRSPSKSLSSDPPKTAASWGLMDANRIYASSELMTEALAYRFATVFDAWCFFDPEATWDVSAKDFRKRAAALRLVQEPVDVEAVIRKLDASCQDSIGPLDFVNALKWHELGAGVNDLRLSFDAAAKRRQAAGAVAIRRSKEPKLLRPAEQAMSVAEEVSAEEERSRKESIRKRAAENEERQHRLREQLGPPQIFKDFARKRDWKHLLELQMDVLRIDLALDQMRISAEEDITGVRCQDLSTQYYRRCAPLYDIPPSQRDEAACLIQRTLRALSAWRSKTELQALHQANPSLFALGRSEPRHETIRVIKSQLMALGRHVSIEELWVQDENPDPDPTLMMAQQESKLREELLRAKQGISSLEQWELAEIKMQIKKKGDDKHADFVRRTAEAILLLLRQGAQPEAIEWPAVAGLLANARGLSDELMAYDADKVDDKRFLMVASNAAYSQMVLGPDRQAGRGQGGPVQALSCWLRAVCALKQFLLDKHLRGRQGGWEEHERGDAVTGVAASGEHGDFAGNEADCWKREVKDVEDGGAV